MALREDTYGSWIDAAEQFVEKDLGRVAVIVKKIMEVVVDINQQFITMERARNEARGAVAAKLAEENVDVDVIRALVVPEPTDWSSAVSALLPVIRDAYCASLHEPPEAKDPPGLVVTVDTAKGPVRVTVDADATFADLIMALKRSTSYCPTNPRIVDQYGTPFQTELMIRSVSPTTSFNVIGDEV